MLWICLLDAPLKIAAGEAKHNIHKRMTKEHLQEVFNVEHVGQVPNYVLAPVHIQHHDFIRFKRSAGEDPSSSSSSSQSETSGNMPLSGNLQMLLQAFDKKFHLNLKKVNHMLGPGKQGKVFYADMVDGKPVLLEAGPELSLSSLQEALYQDIDNMAALSIRTSKDQDDSLCLLRVLKLLVVCDGVLSDEYIIKPIPKELKVVINVDSSDGALIGGDADDAATNSSSSTLATTRTTRLPLGAAELNLDILQSQSNLSSAFPDVNMNETSAHYHIIYKRALASPAASKNHLSSRTDISEDGYIMSETEDFASILPDHDYGLLSDSVFVELPSSHKSGRSKRSFPHHTVWPEVLVLVDFATYNLHGGNEKRITSYFATFWNAVDLRYRKLQQPDIRLQLSGIIISRNPAFMPYIEENRMASPDDDSFDSKQALSDMAKYLFQQQDMLPKFDLAMVITKLDMCRKKDDDGPCVRGTAGFAYVGGACHVDESRQKLNKAGIVEDSGGFSGVIVAAHEVGHLLGCVHDGTSAPSYLGGPGAEACSWYDGYIMSDLRHNVNGFKWSSCSVAQFDHFLSRPQAACLFDSPVPGIRLGNTLPGKIIPLDWQCRLDRGTTACFKDERVCTQLYCHDKDTGYCIAFRPAAEGSPCGDSGKYCRDGLCITEGGVGIPAEVALGSQSVEEENCEGDVPGVRVSGMPCKEFLRVTGMTYCDHRDILRYCCASRRIFCSGK
ncbi:putative A disintegrin and metalloproteinase with thrombospondin motifs 16 [Hypsibius exemplaris]|uniref:A disintegrin and metalloproteinase with thrombospondin motifs 16 n=1 Tax=Hypsibius exemplaris TaxID=2072580 RepID=A0A9X6RKA9_HYPEX|nr:putative A disintegrin and metalloproteinase with thrombospondin motifs 16 [Hypsibius exemplaris]